MVAKVGDDVFGSGTLQNFKEHGIDVDHVGVTKDAATGVATILVDQEGQNCIVIVPGANFILSNEDLLTAEEIIAGAKVLICQLEIKPEVTLKALQLGKKHKGVCSALG
jgi:ribokinase